MITIHSLNILLFDFFITINNRCSARPPTGSASPSTSLLASPLSLPQPSSLSTSPQSSRVSIAPLSRQLRRNLQGKRVCPQVQAAAAHPPRQRTFLFMQQSGLYPQKYLYTSLAFDPENEVMRIVTLRAAGFLTQEFSINQLIPWSYRGTARITQTCWHSQSSLSLAWPPSLTTRWYTSTSLPRRPFSARGMASGTRRQ